MVNNTTTTYRGTVSLSIAWDWETVDKHELMEDVRKLFSDVTVDCYGRDAASQVKVWILQGTTIWNLRAFTQSLTDLLPSFDIEHYSYSGN